MNGEMTVSSTLGKGTTFCVTLQNVKTGRLPEKNDEPEVAQPTAARPHEEDRPLRLLLVDDQKLNLMVLKAMLAKIGKFHFTQAGNGHEAMKLLEDPDVPPFDMVLTDMWMPEMDGSALVQAIRREPELADLPVYAITADTETAKNYSELGFSGILIKPRHSREPSGSSAIRRYPLNAPFTFEDGRGLLAAGNKSVRIRPAGGEDRPVIPDLRLQWTGGRGTLCTCIQ